MVVLLGDYRKTEDRAYLDWVTRNGNENDKDRTIASGEVQTIWIVQSGSDDYILSWSFCDAYIKYSTVMHRVTDWRRLKPRLIIYNWFYSE